MDDKVVKQMELKDTVNGMLSEDYRERFKAELDQMKIRVRKLEDLIYKYDTKKLDFELNCNIEMLRLQLNAMWSYLCLLEQRAVIEKIY